MKLSRVILGIGCAALLGVALAQAVKQVSVSLAGKSLKLDSVVVSGKTYVSLEQLKKALPNPVGGANQAAGTTGCVNQMLFNGAWRFRVQKVFFSIEEKTWFITVELRNAMNRTAYAYGNGSEGIGDDVTLSMASGNTLNISNANEAQDTIILKNLAPGAGTVANFEFSADTDADKPTKFLWAMSAANNTNKAPLSKEPAFRVDLTCTK
jgi:hypothetical protein